MILLQRLKRNNKTHVAKWITALMTAILLAVSMTMPAWAAPDNDFEITIVALPQGYTHLEVGSDIGNAPSGPSKVMTTFGELKSKNRINIVTGQYTDKDGNKQNSFKFSSIGDALKARGSFTHLYYHGENDPAIDNLHTEYISKLTVDLFSDYFTDAYPWEYGVLYIKMDSLQPHSSYTNAKDTSNQYTDSYTYNQNNQFTGAVITAAYPNAGGSTSGDIQSYVSTETTITATANTNHTEDAPNGYRFDHWEKNGNYFSDQPSVSVMCDGSIDAYVAIFVKENEANGVFTEPDDPSHGSTSGDTYRRDGAAVNSQATIQAFPKSDSYVFDHWNLTRDGVTTQEKISTANPYTVKVEDSRDVYTAVFNEVSGEEGVFTEPDDPSHGSTTGDTYRMVNGQKISQTTIQAIPESEEYEFDHWKLTRDGVEQTTTYSSNPCIVKVGDYKDVYTAVFKKRTETNGVFTKPDDAAHGSTTGDTYRIVNGQKVSQTTIQAIPESDAYKFDHWDLTRSTSSGIVTTENISRSNPLIVKVGDYKDVYTAVFVERTEDNGVFTEADDPSRGTTSGDTYRKENGQIVNQTTIQAFPESDEYVFDHWELTSDGVSKGRVSNANPYTVKVGDRIDVYTAVFVKEIEGDGVFTDVDDPSHGTTSGDTYRKVNGQTVTQTTIQAFPTSNEWIFSYWELIRDGGTGTKISVANPYTVKVRDNSDLYVAHFRKRSSGGSGDNPSKNVKGKATGATDKLIDDNKRLFTDPSLTVDRRYVAALAQDTMGAQAGRYNISSPYSGASANLDSLKTGLTAEEKKERLDNEGFELVSADGEVIDINKVNVNTKIESQARDAVIDKFGSLYGSEILIAGDVAMAPKDEGKGSTLFWADTGAKMGERLMLIQQLPDSTSRKITPVVDEKGDVRFTIRDLSGSRLILVRVNYKRNG